MRRIVWLAVVMVLALPVGAMAQQAAGGELSKDQLIYKGSKVEVQIDVDGQGAMQLLGGVLDAAAATAEEQAKAMAAGGGPQIPGVPVAQIAPVAAELIGPVKEAVKSITRVSVVVMKPGEGAAREEVGGYYSKLMEARGWSPLLTVRAEEEANIVLMLAPGAKGVFGMVHADEELIVGMVTANRPLGDVIGQIVRVAGAKMPGILMRMRAAQATAHAIGPPETVAAPE